jgi:hypothetical protein
MSKKSIIFIILLLTTIPLLSQNRQDGTLKREVTLYNPYKPSLPDVVKKSFLPDMTDTTRVRPDFRYDVRTYPFMPPYVISPIKAATMQPDPLPKLYNSYVNFGFGNYLTPLAEISITGQRSKKANIGLYASHFSTNGNVKLQNSQKAFAGYMDNNISLYGRKFMKKSALYGSACLSQKTRYAYGYDPGFIGYEPDKKDIRLSYNKAQAEIGFASSGLDSSDFAYDFGLGYNYFFSVSQNWQHSLEFSGEMAKLWKQFYAGAELEAGYYKPSDSISTDYKYLVSFNPYIKRSTAEWDVKLGFKAVVDKKLSGESKIHIYPDLLFGFNIVPEYVSFFAELSGRMEKNEPWEVVEKNPFLLRGKGIYEIENTDYALVVNGGLTGETGIDGRYTLSASYSIVNDYLLFSNYILSDGGVFFSYGNYFKPVTNQAEILNVQGDIAGKVNDKIGFEAGANFYSYTLTANEFPWNKPGWDARASVKYNLRDKIIAGLGFNALGKTKGLVTSYDQSLFVPPAYKEVDIPAHISFSLNAEYRYTKILSFWLKFNNISFSRAYEWAYYPTQRFICLLGFTYSL